VARLVSIESIQEVDMTSHSPNDEAHPEHALSRRTALRLLAVAPVAALGAISYRRGLVNAIQSTGTPAASPVACAASPTASPGPAVVVHTIYDPSATESADQLRFDPPHVTIAVGQTITWKNESQMPHTATGDPAQNPVGKSHPEYIELPAGAEPWGSEMLQPGDSYSHTFTVPGEYRYICIPHVLSGMRGTITVTCG
jgi:plastocyanin